MKRRRSIAALMSVIGVVAVNLTVGRAIYEVLPWKLAGVLLMVVFLQVGFVYLVFSRANPRWYGFWAGIELGGVLGLTSFVYARVPDTWLGDLWDRYALFVDRLLLEHFHTPVLNRAPEDPIFLLAVTTFAFLPQFVLAVLGGVIGISIGSSPRSRRVLSRVLKILLLLAGSTVIWMAAWIMLPAQPAWIYVGITPGVLLLQIGLYGCFRNWKASRARAFWGAFEVVVALVLWSYVKAMVFPSVPVALSLPDQLSRTSISSPAAPSSADSLLALWMGYTARASATLGRPAHGTSQVAWSGIPTDSLVYFLIVLVPHLLPAVAGGILAVFIARLADGRRRGPAETR
jgi:hypothetical protein